MNAFMVIVLVFSAILLFATMFVTSLYDRTAVNDFYPIDGTELAIVYSNRKENGIYEGPEQTCTLRVEGSFGHDWGIALEEPYLYVNEYSYTDMGLIHCDLVRIDLGTFEKETLLRDTVLRGRCLSGELVCVTGFLMPSTFPETNSMCLLYAMTDANIQPGSDASHVLFLDPTTAETLADMWVAGDLGDDFEETYLDKSFEEVLEEVAA